MIDDRIDSGSWLTNFSCLPHQGPVINRSGIHLNFFHGCLDIHTALNFSQLIFESGQENKPFETLGRESPLYSKVTLHVQNNPFRRICKFASKTPPPHFFSTFLLLRNHHHRLRQRQQCRHHRKMKATVPLLSTPSSSPSIHSSYSPLLTLLLPARRRLGSRYRPAPV